jgi:aspartate racemase
MKTMGLIGGMSWESTASYYQALNQGVKAKLGRLHSAKIILHSVDFSEIEQLQHQQRWDELGDILTAAAVNLEQSGADFLMICTNTMHKVAPKIETSVNIPLLHIADATAQKLVKDKVKVVGLLGTKFTMVESFYKERISIDYGIQVIIPEEQDLEIAHSIIYNELCQGEINAESRQEYIRVINSLVNKGAEAIILGCTEIGLLVEQQHTPIPLYDTTAIHAQAAVNLATSQLD